MIRGVAVVATLVLSACAGPRLIWTGRDSSRHLRAEVLAQGNSQWLRVGQAQGERFEAIGTDGIVFAADGSAVAYPALREGKWFIIAREKTLGPFDGVVDLRFDPTGVRLAFIAESADGFRAIVDGRPTPAFERIQPGTLQFSRSGQHVGFVGSTGNCATIVVDGTHSPCHERVLSLRVTDQGTAAAVIGSGGKQRLLSSELGPAFDEITEWAISESGRIAYAARAGSRFVVILDGTVSSDCEAVRHLRFGDGGRRAAWVCSDTGLASVVIDGVPGPRFPWVSAPSVAARAATVAYFARDPQGAWVVIGDSKRGPYAHVAELALAKNGQGFAFVARSSGVSSVVHGTGETPVDAVVEGSLVVSDDGSHWAAITGESTTQALWLTIDGARRRQLVSAEVFGAGNQQFGAWMTRELRR